MHLLEPWLWKTKYNNKHKRPTPIAGRECSPYPRCILKIFQIFGSENKSNNSNFYAPLVVKQGAMSVIIYINMRGIDPRLRGDDEKRRGDGSKKPNLVLYAADGMTKGTTATRNNMSKILFCRQAQKIHISIYIIL